MDSFEVGSRTIGPDEPTFVIAEAGSNHNGNLEMAKELVEAAAEAGADAVKFQTFRADKLYTEQPVDEGDELADQFESLEMPYEWIPELHEYCQSHGVEFMSTPFDSVSASELAPYVPAFKLASMSMSDHEFLETLAETDKPLIVSTGAHPLSAVQKSVSTLEAAGVEDLVLLQCTSSYPTELEQANVRVVETLREEFGYQSGLSDHTTGPRIAPGAAVALGAAVVEKHFTLDNSLPGPDHEFALEPDELDVMIDTIRRTEESLGSREKRVLDVEGPVVESARRAIQAARVIPADKTIEAADVEVTRPGNRQRGAEPHHLDDIVGRTAAVRIDSGDGVTLDRVN
jgi:N-acetylneuraminate synthase